MNWIESKVIEAMTALNRSKTKKTETTKTTVGK
jgi:hypothetical protein